MTDSDNGWRGRTDARLDDAERRIGIVEQHPTTCSQLDIVKDHEKRLRVVETNQAESRGKVVMLSGVVSLAAVFVGRLFQCGRYD